MSIIFKALTETIESNQDINSLKKELEKAQKGFDPNFEYSDDHSYWSEQNRKSKLINDLKKKLKAAGEKLDESKESQYGSEWDEKVKRVGQMAQQGPRKTVWDPVKRVYKTVPIQPSKEKDVSEDDNFKDPAAMMKASPEAIKKAQDIMQAQADKNVIGQAKFAGAIPVSEQEIDEDWQKVNKKDKTDGMSSKAVKAYRRENPGSKLQTAVTTKPSKLKKGSKSAKRRKSFCARMKGMKKAHASAKTKRNPDSPINKALRRWNCESVEELQQLAMLAEQKITKLKKLKEGSDRCSVCGQTPCNCTHVSSIMKGISQK